MIEIEEEFIIRPMTPDDIDEVLEIEKASFPTPWSYDAFLGELTENDFAYYYVSIKNNKVVGYAGMWIVFDEAHVTNVAVHPQYRSKSIGRELMLKLLQKSEAARVRRIMLEVRPSNFKARHLYSSIGFSLVGVRKGYYSDTGEDALIMWKHFLQSQDSK